jgi:hypothetical protein
MPDTRGWLFEERRKNGNQKQVVKTVKIEMTVEDVWDRKQIIKTNLKNLM